MVDEYTIYIRWKNYTHLIVECEYGIAQEFNDLFSFYAKNYRYMPDFKNHIWDGKIRLFNVNKRLLPIGLLKRLVTYCKNDGLEIIIDDEVKEKLKGDDVSIPDYNLPFEPYEHQVSAVEHMLSKKRGLILSPTSSGKSLNLYCASRYNAERGNKTLIIVPTVQLVEQLASDFEDYGWDSEKYVHKIYAGKDKTTDKPVTISTWQSLAKIQQSILHQYNMVIVDEVHLATAVTIKGIMEKCTKADYKLGLTGTLDDTKANKETLISLFGEIFVATTTKELMDQGLVSELKIKAIQLSYPEEVSKIVSKMNYQAEVKFMKSYEPRNAFIVNLTKKMPNNTLVLFQHKAHGKALYESMKDHSEHVYYIDGDTDVDLRTAYTDKFEQHDDVIIVASYGVFSTGINSKNLHYIIFASSYKSKIKVLQSIGRGLRLHVNKNGITLFDLGDRHKYLKYTNTIFKHFIERIKLYEKEKFNYKIMKVNLK